MNTNNQAKTNISKWMPLRIGDIRRETNSHPLEFQAMYVNLLMAAWERGGQLPDDEKQLMRISGADRNQWIEYRQELANLFVPGEGQWTHNLIREELAKAYKIHAKRTEAGRIGAVNRWGQSRGQAKAATDSILEKIAKDCAAY